MPDARPLLARRHAPGFPVAPERVPQYPILGDPAVPAFGFVARPLEELSGAELHTLMGSFGPPLSPRPLVPAVRVVVAAAPLAGVLPTDLVEAKRAVWADPVRNDHIAHLARDEAVEPARGVAVLTGSATQTAELARRLSDWTVVPAGAGDRLPNRALVTEAWLVRGGRFGADVVVDARGWGAMGPADFSPAANVLLIDVPVDAHPEFATRTCARLEAYLTYGWPSDGADTR